MQRILSMRREARDNIMKKFGLVTGSEMLADHSELKAKGLRERAARLRTNGSPEALAAAAEAEKHAIFAKMEADHYRGLAVRARETIRKRKIKDGQMTSPHDMDSLTYILGLSSLNEESQGASDPHDMVNLADMLRSSTLSDVSQGAYDPRDMEGLADMPGSSTLSEVSQGKSKKRRGVESARSAPAKWADHDRTSAAVARLQGAKQRRDDASWFSNQAIRAAQAAPTDPVLMENSARAKEAEDAAMAEFKTTKLDTLRGEKVGGAVVSRIGSELPLQTRNSNGGRKTRGRKSRGRKTRGRKSRRRKSRRRKF